MAIDTSRNMSAQSAPVAVTTPVIPDSVPPVVLIVSPSPGAVISNGSYVYAVTYDVRGGLYDEASGPAAVQFTIDGASAGPEQTMPYNATNTYLVFRIRLDEAGVGPGARVLGASARDRAGNVGVSSDVPVTITP
jgi:hypothetical protein